MQPSSSSILDSAGKALRRGWPWLTTALGPIALFGPMLLRGDVLFWGTPLLQFVPWRTAALRAIASGHLPLWNPLVGMGAPLLANYQVGVFYPPHVVLALLGPEWGHGLLVMLHLILAAWGMVALARRLGLGAAAQVVAGAAFSLSGYLVARAGFLSINAAAAWLPWGVWAADRLGEAAARGIRERRFITAAARLGLVLGLQLLAGHAQTVAYSLVVVTAWALGRAYVEGRGRAVAAAAAGLTGAGMLGMCLSAVQLVPTVEYLAQSARQGGVDASFAMTYSFWPWRLLGFLLPNLFGSPVRGDYWGYGNYWEDAIYLGVLPLVVGLAVAVRALAGRGERPALGRALIGLAVLSTLLALGENTPVFPFLFRSVPGFDLFQAPARWMILAVFSFALLAALGIDAWRAPTGKGLYWTRLGTAGAGAIVGMAVVSRSILTQVRPSFAPAFAVAGVLLFTVGLLSLLKARLPNRLWTSAVCALVLIDLVAAGWGLNPSTSPSLYAGSSQLAGAVDAEHRISMSRDVEYELKFEHYFRFDRFESGLDWRTVRDSGVPNVAVMDGIASVDNFDPLLPGRYVTWMDALDGLPAAAQAPLLRLMDVGAAAETIEGLPRVTYVRLTGASRVRLVGEARWAASPNEALQMTMAQGFDPDASVVLEGEPVLPASTEPGESALEILGDSNPNEVTIRARSAGGGWLVLSDTWYPGWEAELDGRRTPILRADFLFRAVALPAGEHTIAFHYRPLTFYFGAILSLVTIVFLSAAWWRWRRS